MSRCYSVGSFLLAAKRIFYVYYLIDPSTSRVFYVGKGTGERCHEHVSMVQRAQRLPNPHLENKIKKILRQGALPLVRKVFHTNSEARAWAREKSEIKTFGLKNLCNITSGGEGCAGVKQSAEWVEKRVKTYRGKPLTIEHRRKIGESQVGKVVSSASREKMRKSHSGVKLGPHSEEHKRKIGLSNRGKTRDRATREQISKTLRGRKQSEATCKKRSIALSGHATSKETREKISRALKGKNRSPWSAERKTQHSAGVRQWWAARKARSQQ